MPRFVLRFSTSPGFISWAIRHRTDFYISHVEFQLLKTDGDFKAGSTLGSRFPDGVQWREPHENANQRGVIFATADGIDEAAMWVNSNRIGCKYDLLGICGIAGGIEDWHTKGERFCSEIVLEGFEEGPKNFLANRYFKTWQFTPRDFFCLPGIRILSGPHN